MTKVFTVVGSPIGHSLSPLIHLAAYKYLGLDWSYEKHEVAKGDLSEFLFRDGKRFDGLSVTMPLKLEAVEVALTKDPLVERLGIANTLVKSEKGYLAYNTDVFGITQALDGLWVAGLNTVAILGAGATAQSAVMSVYQNAPNSKLVVFVRDTERTTSISDLARELGMSLEVKLLSLYTNEQDLTINTVPSNSIVVSGIRQDGWLLDVNYSSPNTSLNSCFDWERVVTGERMLLWQAIGQIRLFTSLQADSQLPHEAELLKAMEQALSNIS